MKDHTLNKEKSLNAIKICVLESSTKITKNTQECEVKIADKLYKRIDDMMKSIRVSKKANII